MYIVEDFKKILKVVLYCEKIKEIDGVNLRNIFGINLWEESVFIFCSEWIVKYFYCILFDFLV